MSKLLTGRLSSDSRRAIWALADQCSVSGGNFLTNLILIRVLLPVDFGTYALILNAMIFSNSVQMAFITYPLTVRGARANPGQFRRIVAFALFGTTVLLLAFFGPAFFVIGFPLHRPALILAAVIATLLWQLQDTLRTAFIAKLQQRRALVGDSLSYLGQAILLGLISLRTKPGLNVIFWIIAATSLLAFLLQAWQTRPSVPPLRTSRALINEFWTLGRWSVLSRLVAFFTLQAFPWLILLRHGRVQVAGFQALFQFLAFSNPLLFSIGNLITATVAKHRTYRLTSVRNHLLLTAGVLGCYLLLLGVAGPFMMRLLYGSHSQYLVYGPLMRIFAAAWSFEVIASLITAVLGGLREPRSVFILQLSGAIAAILFALPLAYWKGIRAAIFGILVVNIVRAATGILLLLRRRRNGKDRRLPDISNGIEVGSSVPSLVTRSALL
jgi:O-antigen/teichoic acid export membrane protein